MPQTKSAKKALSSSARKRQINDRWRRKVREATLEIRKAIDAGDKKTAEKAYTSAQSTIDRAAKRHIIHKNTAARKKASLLKAIK